MNRRKQIVASAISFALSAMLIQPVNANTATTTNAEPAPAQTQEAVIAASKNEVQDALRDVEKAASRHVAKQRRKLQSQGRSNEVFIAYGKALVSVSSTSPDWGDARVIAYQEAQNKARENFLRQLYAQVSSDIIKESFKTSALPEFTPDELQAQSSAESLLNKVAAYSHAVLDSKLEEQGIDPAEYKAAPLEKRKTMLKQAFTKGVKTRSYGDLSGAMITNTFETTDVNGKTAVAVVMKTSVKMKNILTELRSSKGVITPDENRRGVNIEDYLEANEPNLMYEYGLRLFRDEEGYPVLLSFSQAGNSCNPADYEECADNREFSYIEAYNDAMSHFAEAYNLNGFTESNTNKGKQKVTVARVNQSNETLKETVTTILRETKAMSKMQSEVKGLVGIYEAKKWSETHPVSNREINGVVLAWHPKREQALRTFKAHKTPSATKPAAATPTQKNSSGNRASSAFIMDDSDF
ncbi:hypothetical protein NX722_01915 [Endozoicomonas gorgoniicola]|uniref:DUF6844 domain-containing protein n=1 Tax=Endozoicomonas gorgoniicola TaxID=1234144 RepID=A0ABT3MPX8_9GAMM|nr:hypothetical protein [Endozoicomonas gorgoniicola]MCW7551416.1 hypothetical protein [Endozoicomonas gorgoniicola]